MALGRSRPQRPVESFIYRSCLSLECYFLILDPQEFWERACKHARIESIIFLSVLIAWGIPRRSFLGSRDDPGWPWMSCLVSISELKSREISCAPLGGTFGVPRELLGGPQGPSGGSLGALDGPSGAVVGRGVGPWNLSHPFVCEESHHLSSSLRTQKYRMC